MRDTRSSDEQTAQDLARRKRTFQPQQYKRVAFFSPANKVFPHNVSQKKSTGQMIEWSEGDSTHKSNVPCYRSEDAAQNKLRKALILIPHSSAGCRRTCCAPGCCAAQLLSISLRTCFLPLSSSQLHYSRTDRYIFMFLRRPYHRESLKSDQSC